MSQPMPNAMAELEAMKGVAQALESLDLIARRRVLHWAAAALVGSPPPIPGSRSSDDGFDNPTPEPAEMGDVAAVFARAAPTSGPERALVVGYWLQEQSGGKDFDAFSLNAELKNLGHKLPNVTKTLSLLMSQRPALVIQTRKGGTAQQARKLYRLTIEGLRRVKSMLARTSSEGSHSDTSL